MFITNSILVTVFFNIFCSVLTENVDVRNLSLRGHLFDKNSYRYNHPPSFESYEVIPEKDDRKLETVREEKSVKLYNSEIKTVPVTVIYDAPKDIASSINKDNNNIYLSGRRRKVRRRQQVVNKEVKETIDSQQVTKRIGPLPVTERIISSVPTPSTIVPKVFTKRPPEDNPIPKKPHRQHDPVVKILDEKNFVFSHSGNFHYSYEGGDGTKISSQGELRNFKNDATGEAVVGSVFYKDKDGNDVSLSYTADENGYRPHGAHLPTPPPIPKAIARALAYLATKTTDAPVTEATKKNENLP